MFGCLLEESQEHLMDCIYIIDKLEDKSILAECEYGDIFGKIEQQIEMAKIFFQILNIRDELIDELVEV